MSFELSLRDVEVPPGPATDAPAVDDGLVRSDAEARPVPWLGDPEAERVEQKASRRAQVRRERQQNTEPSEPTPEAPTILVLCANDGASSPLCALLSGFGFGVSTARDLPTLAAPWPFVVVFVDMTDGVPSGIDPIDLCNRVRERSRLPGERKPVLMLVAAQLSATDRVRAGLAGCNEVIVGDVSRGSVARAFEARGIALPSDARRA
jgi:CheY-like chemotaxis protein